jgi:excisionase family DNA binding protein
MPGDTFVDAIADAVAARLTTMQGRKQRLLDLDAAAEYLSLSDDAMRDLVAQGKIKPVRPTRKVQFDVLDLDQFIEDLKKRNGQGHVSITDIAKPIEPVYRLFGARVQQLREVLGVSQEEFAKKVALTRTSITNIEAGKQRILLHDVERFASAFGVTARHLMKGIWL